MKPIEVSIVICTYNRAQYLHTALEHIAQLESPSLGFEVIVVNNNSQDETEALVKDFMSTNPDLDVRYFNEANQGLSFARNRGVAESQGTIVGFIDDDAFVETDFILNLHQYFQANQTVAAIGGKITPIYETKEPAWMSSFLLPLVAGLDMGSKVKEFKGRKFPIGANMAFRKEVFDKYGKFNTDLGRKGKLLEGGEEKDFIYRLKKNGECVYYVPNIRVKHTIPENRTKPAYIRAQAKGVAISEVKRLSKSNTSAKIGKALEELAKTAATAVLALIFILQLKFQKAVMLLKFRAWVISGYFEKQ